MNREARGLGGRGGGDGRRRCCSTRGAGGAAARLLSRFPGGEGLRGARVPQQGSPRGLAALRGRGRGGRGWEGALRASGEASGGGRLPARGRCSAPASQGGSGGSRSLVSSALPSGRRAGSLQAPAPRMKEGRRQTRLWQKDSSLLKRCVNSPHSHLCQVCACSAFYFHPLKGWVYSKQPLLLLATFTKG